MKLQDKFGFSGPALYLIDGSAFIYRSFYANRHLRRSDGFPTNAIFLVSRILLKILREQNPQFLLFCLDGKGKNFRHEIYDQYKANRPPMPEDLVLQLEPIQEMVKSLGIPVEIARNCEADDCMASLASRFSSQMPVILVSGDKDLKQCLSDNTIIWDPASKEEKILTKNQFEEETGVTPEHWPDVQALVGDTADNIPGVPGIGPKTALQIFSQFPSLEIIKKNLDELPAKIQARLKPHLEDMFRWRRLTTLKKDVCANLQLADMAVLPINLEESRKQALKYELSSIARELGQMVLSAKDESSDKAGQKTLLANPEAGKTKIEEIPRLASPDALPDCQGRDVAVLKPASEKNPILAVSADSETQVFQWMGPLAELCRWLAGAGKLIAADLKSLLRHSISFSRLAAQKDSPWFFDIGLATYLLNPESEDYSWSRLAAAWRAESGDTTEAEAALAPGMAKAMLEKLRTAHLYDLYEEIEIPLVPVLAGMEERGITIDPGSFQNFLAEVNEKLQKLTQEIYAAAGQEFNIRSSRQLGQILLARLGLSTGKKTRTGQLSTTQAALEKLAGAHPVVDKVLEYRKLDKLQSTWLDPLPRLMDAENRVHSTFNQKATATGRLSSSNPNLQNIPVRGDLGRRMRACFIAPPGKLMLACDYSQIELRVLAHLSQDAALLNAFRQGEDIHAHTAALIFEKAAAEISPDQRRMAKTINFGLLYGMGARKLAQELKISERQAAEFIERYFAGLGQLKRFYDKILKKAAENGFVSTMAGRIRWVEGIASANGQISAQASRQAINTVIQGTAADIIKLAMIEVSRDALLRDLRAELVLQVHDELLLEAPEENARAACQRVASIMEAVKPGKQSLSIPLAVDQGIGKNWAEAH